MFELVTTFLGPFLPYLITGGVIVLSLLGVHFKSKRAGKIEGLAQAKAEQDKNDGIIRNKYTGVTARIDGMSDAAVDDELRKQRSQHPHP